MLKQPIPNEVTKSTDDIKAPLNPKTENKAQPAKRPRYFGIDILRVFSCYMVMQIHAGEYYYIGENVTVRKGTGPFWVGIYNSIFRSCVPLFVMISGYLLLPVKTDIPTFLRTRFTRVLFPFFFWCALYSFYYLILKRINVKECFINIGLIFVNYGTDVGHLWYIYMLIGIYLFAPIISPWIKQATVPQFIYYLSFWAVSMCIRYIHIIFPAIWGECPWNNTPMLQSFTGHFGYAVLGAFIKIHLDPEEKYNFYWLGFILLALGYSISLVGWEYHYFIGTVSAVDQEMSWDFHTINIAMMAFGWFLLLRKIQCNQKIIVAVFQDVALKSYGMYLAHIMVLDQFHTLFDPDNKRPCIFIPIIAICTFIVTYLVIKILSYIPYSKYLIG
ncbi:hypothetical protein M9Y10_023167 [Tritrichomonas musculus]|uniref:Acyltransferase 3 domain-containing protein n=1 Tax=Tritrichomonas musculus TaxID=1915356 RepID=A0ABR2KUC5_9EUKA